MSVKPILFNTEMVQAILDGRKTVTRRVIKLKYSNTHIEWKNDKYGKRLIELQNDVEGETHGRNPDGSTWHKFLAYRELKAPYTKGDILYVRETWNTSCVNCECDCPAICNTPKFRYKADYETMEDKWKPSIHMPKEAARIWLKVTGVRVEQLSNMTVDGALREGIKTDGIITNQGPIEYRVWNRMQELWNSTIPKQDRDKYGWDANPWVWVIEFERCEKPEEG